MLPIRAFILVLFTLLLPAAAPAAALLDTITTLSGLTVPRLTRLEIGIAAIRLNPYAGLNPYLPSDVDMYALFTAPDGRVYRRDAFFYQPWWRCFVCPQEIEQPCHWKEVPERRLPDPDAYMSPRYTSWPWRVRFAPPDTGRWSYKVYVISRGSRDSSAAYSFQVTPSDEKGYITTGRDTPSRYFRYRNTGEVFIPLGVNSTRVTSHSDTLYNRIAMMVATELISQMAPYGGNYLRIFMGPENFGIEWRGGLNNYTNRQHYAADLDSVFALAEKHKVYLHLNIATNGDLALEDWWPNNPYRRINGGPIDSREAFFTDPVAKRIFLNRVRYTVARWGYSPYLFSYEPMQEINHFGGDYWGNVDTIKAWYRDVIRYIKTLDSNHLFTVSATSAGNGKFGGNGGIYALDEIDYINEHHYGADYNLAFQRDYVARMDMAYYPRKPMLFGEAGIAWGRTWLGGNSLTGRQAFHLVEWHNSLWSTLFGGMAGPGLFWANYRDVINPECWGGQYRYFRPLTRFIEGDSIFYHQPLPIANRCLGRGAKDYLWQDTASWAPGFTWDSVTNPGLCFPRWYVLERELNRAFVSSGISTSNDSLIEVFGLRISDRVLGWVHHKMNYWYELPHQAGGDESDPSIKAELNFILDNMPLDSANHRIPFLEGEYMSVEGMDEGGYLLQFYSTWPEYEADTSRPAVEDGGVIPTMTREVMVDSTGIARFQIPLLRPIYKGTVIHAPDYGFKLIKLP